MNASAAATVFAVLSLLAAAFQLALAAGMPWGALAMGGKHPGRFPPNLRVGAVFQAAILLVLAASVLARSGLAFRGMRSAAFTVWFAVGFSALSLLLNLATPSKWERRLWAPVALGMLASSLIVALS